jgi:hypothetical protein
VFEPLKAIDALNERDVDYVVVGGWGSLQHGASRLTQDLDICPELSVENLERLAQALTHLQARLQIAPDQTIPVPIIDGRLLSQMQIGNWSTDAGGVDVLQHIPGPDGRQLGYPELRQHATEVADDRRVFAVASLADITASKRAAGRQKDLEALPELERLLAENLPSRQ